MRFWPIFVLEPFLVPFKGAPVGVWIVSLYFCSHCVFKAVETRGFRTEAIFRATWSLDKISSLKRATTSSSMKGEQVSAVGKVVISIECMCWYGTVFNPFIIFSFAIDKCGVIVDRFLFYSDNEGAMSNMEWWVSPQRMGTDSWDKGGWSIF